MFQRNLKSMTNSSSLSPQAQQVLKDLRTNLDSGLTSDEATQRREETGSFNVVKPPINCPGWVCCLLPCIKSIPSMKAFAMIKPDDAEVLRNGKWIRYDAASLVKGDIVRMEEGDVVPADCLVLQLSIPEEELLVDLRPITGEERLKSLSDTVLQNDTKTLHKLYMGGKVVQGGAMAVITETGPDTLLARLIREKRFPPKEPILEVNVGTALS